MIKIILADDQQMFLDGMRNRLEKEKDIEIVGEALTGDEVLNILQQKSVDLVILDINMPGGMDGIEATKLIRRNFPSTKVLILSMFDNKEFIIKLIRNGASGYILKNKTSSELVMAIHNVVAGRTHYSLEIMGHATKVSMTDREEEIQLSNREMEILLHVAEGYSSDEISEQLGIATLTVSKHRTNILGKLKLKNSVQLTRYAVKKGLVKI